MRPHLFTAAPLLCALAIAGPALADSAAADHQFQSMDMSGDDQLSLDEHSEGSDQMFDSMDANQDGLVTSQEMHTAHRLITGQPHQPSDPSATDKIRAIDTDGDGVLSKREHEAGSRAMFKKMDTDQDGYLSKHEHQAGHDQILPSTEPNAAGQ